MDLKSIVDTRRKGEPDLFLFISVFVIVGIGIAMSYSASAVYALTTFGDSFYFLKRQIIWFIVGFGAMLFFQEIDYRNYLKYTKIMLLMSIVLLVVVFIPGIGHTVKGSVRWVNLGFFKFQPSEFVKLFIVIYLVKVFSSDNSGVVNNVIQLLIPMLIVGVVFMLLMFQPDFGTAIELIIVSVLIMFVSGFPIAYIVMLFLVSVPMFYLLVYQVSYRRDRVVAFFDPWSDRFGIGYHIIQSYIAFKKGGLLGMGLGHGTQKIHRLPEPHTDFIFAVIAEEAGLVGTVLLVGLYCVIFWRGIAIAVDAPDEFGKLLAIGLTLLIIVQAFVNIGVVSGSLPTTGIPLPFLSYGGSSLVVSMSAVGILLNISRYREAAFQGAQLSEEVLQ